MRHAGACTSARARATRTASCPCRRRRRTCLAQRRAPAPRPRFSPPQQQARHRCPAVALRTRSEAPDRAPETSVSTGMPVLRSRNDHRTDRSAAPSTGHPEPRGARGRGRVAAATRAVPRISVSTGQGPRSARTRVPSPAQAVSTAVFAAMASHNSGEREVSVGIRAPALSASHKLFLSPKSPRYRARPPSG
jgi:hypothetical protein